MYGTRGWRARYVKNVYTSIIIKCVFYKEEKRKFLIYIFLNIYYT